MTDVMCAAISTQRPFGWVFSYMADAQQSIKGQFSFFETDQNHIGSVMNSFAQTGVNDDIICVVCGRMTSKQRRIIEESHCRLNPKAYCDIMRWFIEDAKHPAYKNITPPNDCPQPTLLTSSDTRNNTNDRLIVELKNNSREVLILLQVHWIQHLRVDYMLTQHNLHYLC